MDIILALKAIIMGLVEGFTEFLPISSTGHLILAGSLLDFTTEKAKVFDIAIQAAALQHSTTEKAKLSNIAIQAGAILAVMWEYRARIGAVFAGITSEPRQQK